MGTTTVTNKAVLTEINAIKFSKAGFKHVVAVDVNFTDSIITVGLANSITGLRSVTYTKVDSTVDFLTKLQDEILADHEAAKKMFKDNASAFILKLTALDDARNSLKDALSGSNHNTKVIADLLASAKAAELAKSASKKALEDNLEALKARQVEIEAAIATLNASADQA